MRKNKILSLGIAFLFLTVLGLSGCVWTLSAPQISRDGFALSWDWVTNADSYDVHLSNGDSSTTVSTSSSSLDLTSYLDAGEWTIKAKAKKGDSFFRKSSPYSEELSFKVLNLPTVPTGVLVNEDEYKVIVQWDSINDASSYCIKINLQNSLSSPTVLLVNGERTSQDITRYITSGGEYKISLCANALIHNGVEGIYISNYSDEVDYGHTARLSAPEVDGFSNKILSWKSVEGASGYNISLLGTDKKIYTTNTSVDISTIEGGLPRVAKLNGEPNSSIFQVAFVQAVGSEFGFTSDFSWGEVYYGVNASASNFEGIDIDYFYSDFGAVESFDFRADNQAELNALVCFAVYYRISEIKFYQNFTNSNAVSIAFNEYTEIMSLSRVLSGSSLLTLKMKYFTPSTPEYVAVQSYSGQYNNIEQVDYGNISSYSHNPRSADSEYSETDLPIYSRTQSMNVYTSEQLFMAVQAGYLPVIINDTGAQRVWDEACAVAMDILDDSMTDYQKVLAIFDWVCYNNIYDHNLYSYAVALDSATGSEYNTIDDMIRDFKGFYLEGIFLDNGQAVCDGISKAFALLCGIEDIDCYKVNGDAGGGHAWNKVALDLDNNGTKEWYTVDCTWNDSYTYSENSSEIKGDEWLTHSYFLITDNSIGTHTEEWPNINPAITSFNYWTWTKVDIDGADYDMNIETALEIDTFIEYMCNNFDNFDIRINSGLEGLVWGSIMLNGNWKYKVVDSKSGYTNCVVYKTLYE